MQNNLKNVTIVGSGTQGSMLAFRSAAFGRKVSLYDLSEAQLVFAMKKIKGWFGDWVEKDLISPRDAAAAYEGITTTTSLTETLKDCDIVIEKLIL